MKEDNESWIGNAWSDRMIYGGLMMTWVTLGVVLGYCEVSREHVSYFGYSGFLDIGSCIKRRKRQRLLSKALFSNMYVCTVQIDDLIPDEFVCPNHVRLPSQGPLMLHQPLSSPSSPCATLSLNSRQPHVSFIGIRTSAFFHRPRTSLFEQRRQG